MTTHTHKTTAHSDAVLLAGVDGDIVMWDVTMRVVSSAIDVSEDFNPTEDDEQEFEDESEESFENFSVVMHTTSMSEALLHVESNKAYFLEKLGFDPADICEVVGLCKNDVSLFLIKGPTH